MTTAPIIEPLAMETNLSWFRGRSVLEPISFDSYTELAPRFIPRWFEYYQRDSSKIAFNRCINKLRRQHRTRPSYNVGVTESSGSCYSVRQRTERPTNRKYPEPLETRPEQFDGQVIPIWHQPDHLVFSKTPSETDEQFEARVYAKPSYTGEHVIMLGDAPVPANEIYSQGENRVSVRGEEVIVTDFWAVEYASGWGGFVDARIHLHDGDRKRDEFFEPTKQQMSSWREKHTKNGEFKKKTHPRFRRTLHKWLFKNQTDEAPSISQNFHPKELEYDFNDVYEDGGYVESEIEQPEDAEQVGQVTKPKPGQPWCDDPNFVDDLNAMLPKGYSKLRGYQSGYRVPLPDMRLAPPRDLDKSTYSIVQVTQSSCSTYLVPKTELIPIHPSSVGVGDSSDCGLTESERWTRMLGTLEQITTAEQKQCEAILRSAADYDPRQHQTLGHFYEYAFKYYREIALGDGVFHTVKNTTKTKKNPLKRIVVGWDDAIRNTFGHLVEDTPPDGFYVMYKMSDLAATRVYPILLNRQTDFVLDEHEEPVYPIRNSSAEVIDFDLEAPAPSGIRDIHGQIRTVVGGMRTKSKTTATISADLRNIVRGGEIRHIRFTWDDIRGLTFVISP